MNTNAEFLPPALARATSMVQAMERHVAFLEGQLTRAPALKTDRLKLDLETARRDLALRRATEVEAREEMNRGRQLSLFSETSVRP